MLTTDYPTANNTLPQNEKKMPQAYSPASVEVLICLLTVVKALKGRINSAQCGAKRWEKRHRISAEGCKPDVIQWLIVNC